MKTPEEGKLEDRLDAPSCHQNLDPILRILKPRVSPLHGTALEIGSGTGQHIVEFARSFPNLEWQPSDIIEAHLRSIRGWQKATSVANLLDPILLDVSDPDWDRRISSHIPTDGFPLIVCINVVHISPWSATQGLFAGAAHTLAPQGMLYFYGPYKRDGLHTAPSNQRFDLDLRRRNPDWGVRDIAEMEETGKRSGLRLEQVIDMPVNNFSLVFRRDP